MPTIYSISHPSQPNVIYIGKTQASLKERLANHINSNNTSAVKIWLSNLMHKNNKKPRIEQIEICDCSIAYEAERFWIEQFRVWGFKILNTNGNISKTGRACQGYKKKPKKLISQFDLNGNLVKTYAGVDEASRVSKISKWVIYHQLKGKRKNPRKYIFKYAA
jgi:hypothetical protein